MASEIPRLYAVRSRGGGNASPEPAPALVRILSALCFLPLAAYLQLAGLRRNARSRRNGSPQAEFRTVAHPDRVVYQSRRFENLRHRYESPDSTPAPGGAAPSRIPTLR
jgi:hypothetical protein